jgi:hypothetical protein
VQEAPGLPFNDEVANTIKSLPYVKDVIPGYTAQVQLNVQGNMENANVFATEATVAWAVAPIFLYSFDNENVVREMETTTEYL